MKLFTASLLALILAFATGRITAARGDRVTGDQSMVAIATSDTRFSTLVDLVLFAELDGVLANERPFTVVAPTNDAFDA
jgi:uncharacterized surface protein with fasciclin (FAS1) repeats